MLHSPLSHGLLFPPQLSQCMRIDELLLSWMSACLTEDTQTHELPGGCQETIADFMSLQHQHDGCRGERASGFSVCVRPMRGGHWFSSVTFTLQQWSRAGHKRLSLSPVHTAWLVCVQVPTKAISAKKHAWEIAPYISNVSNAHRSTMGTATMSQDMTKSHLSYTFCLCHLSSKKIMTIQFCSLNWLRQTYTLLYYTGAKVPLMVEKCHYDNLCMWSKLKLH